MSLRIRVLGTITNLAYAVAAWAETRRELDDDLADYQQTGHRWIR